MARKPEPAAGQIDPHANYRVTLARAVEIAPQVWARPGDDVVVTGEKLLELGDAVLTSEPA